ncbi:MAG: A/G-specific adenine glycosylase, partial [Blautia sp.]
MLEEITGPLLGWYEENKRDLPWRREPEPYHVWVSEIMLQQTRVEAVKEYYRRFLEALPKIPDLAACEEERLLKLWEGLGYYNRVKNMQKAARILVSEYGGNMPADYGKILELPGIGSYTAGAVSSIAFGIKKPAVDGNVLRVLSRITEWGEDIGKQSTKKKAEQILEEMMPGDRPGTFNQSLMELGAVVCVPNGTPKCEQCPVSGFCLAVKHGTISQYPKKTSPKKRRIEEKTVLL